MPDLPVPGDNGEAGSHQPGTTQAAVGGVPGSVGGMIAARGSCILHSAAGAAGCEGAAWL